LTPFQYIAIEGPIGVGKSSLAQRVATRLDATAVLEDADNPFLADFYTGRAGAALQAQLFFLLNRHRQLVGLQQGNLFAQATICDYLFDKDKISRISISTITSCSSINVCTICLRRMSLHPTS
jgi:deoxyadenosine/deoxycytidine kinase